MAARNNTARLAPTDAIALIHGVGGVASIAHPFDAPDVDALVDAGLLEPLGFYGWSTFVGRWRG